MRFIAVIALIALCLVHREGISSTRAADTITALPHEVRRTLSDFKLDGSGFSAYIKRIGDSSPLLTFNSQQGRNPASTIKLLTTLVALEQLGPAYTWHTDVYADGEINAGTLHGNLLIRGGGDPYLTLERLWLLVHHLRNTGLNAITGDLIIDQQLFAPIDKHSSTLDQRPFHAYNVTPAALISNFNVTQLTFTPDLARGRVRVDLEPALPGFKLENKLILRNKSCSGDQRGIHLSRNNKGALRVEGAFSKHCRPYVISRSVLDKDVYNTQLFRQLWHESGGHWPGDWQRGTVDEQMRRLLRFKSLPLADIVRLVNKYSNNLMARMLFLTLTVGAGGTPATVEKSRDAVRAWLALKRLEMPELILINGAGLSRETRISAEHMGELLLAGWQSLYMSEFIASMPVSGPDGTLLKQRLREKSLDGKIHAKTGGLDHVVALAGYYQSKRGDRYIVAMLHNARDVHRGAGHAVRDALLSWLAQHVGS